MESGYQAGQPTEYQYSDMFFSEDTAKAARTATGCCLQVLLRNAKAPFAHHFAAEGGLTCLSVDQAVDAVLGGQTRRCFAVVRPPGHHAECDRAMVSRC